MIAETISAEAIDGDRQIRVREVDRWAAAIAGTLNSTTEAVEVATGMDQTGTTDNAREATEVIQLNN